jgi:hypothetical protein
MCRSLLGWVKNQLHEAAAVTQIDENEVAVIASASDPAGELNGTTHMSGPQLAGKSSAQHQASFA